MLLGHQALVRDKRKTSADMPSLVRDKRKTSADMPSLVRDKRKTSADMPSLWVPDPGREKSPRVRIQASLYVHEDFSIVP